MTKTIRLSLTRKKKEKPLKTISMFPAVSICGKNSTQNDKKLKL